MADRALFTLTHGQRLINLPFSFDVGSSKLVISLNGQVLIVNKNYTELSPTQIYLAAPAVSGELLEARILEALP